MNKLTSGHVATIVMSPRLGAQTRRERAQPAKALGRELASCKESIGGTVPKAQREQVRSHSSFQQSPRTGGIGVCASLGLSTSPAPVREG